jgi:hypothetical protein
VLEHPRQTGWPTIRIRLCLRSSVLLFYRRDGLRARFGGRDDGQLLLGRGLRRPLRRRRRGLRRDSCFDGRLDG